MLRCRQHMPPGVKLTLRMAWIPGYTEVQERLVGNILKQDPGGFLFSEVATPPKRPGSAPPSSGHDLTDKHHHLHATLSDCCPHWLFFPRHGMTLFLSFSL